MTIQGSERSGAAQAITQASTPLRSPPRIVVPVAAAAAALFVIGAPGQIAAIARARLVRAAALTARIAVWMAAGLTLFIVYLHVARTSANTSDGASNALQAWDMLHGNVLLHGWQVSDVSFYTTELPQYMLIEHLRGLGPSVIHIASAMTYTLAVLLAALLAKGKSTGREAIISCLLAAGIMLAPQLGDGIFLLMGSPDHFGSTVPVLAAFVVLDRAPRSWYSPMLAGLVLAVALIADGIVAITGIVPTVGVCLARIYLARFKLRQRLRACWFELEVAAAVTAAFWFASAALRAIAAHGGFAVWPITSMLVPAGQLPHSLLITGQGLLLLFGADFLGHSAGLLAALAAVHLVGLGLVGLAAFAAVRRFGRADLVVQLLVAAIAVTLAAYLLSTRVTDLLSTRDITAVLPLGAALAGRTLAARVARAGLLPALGVAAAGYLISLGQAASQPPATPTSAWLAHWLAARHLDYGLAGYWNASVTTVQSRGQVRLRSMAGGNARATSGHWEARAAWYDPALHDATFVVLSAVPKGHSAPSMGAVRQAFGQPQQIYDLHRYTIMVWDKNLLTELIRGEPRPTGQASTPLP